ncbi:multidrug and toxin extrusion protein 2-like isoform X1 [Acropora millepora]|uniref:multidrug and toxin extrusion protein 2-like isoform X1 n=1 Tax=Acropora millepora TaxID=45264 RepID=UPI001CF48C34|nr:multidrug and toxin extrusion protein 2-like isoform X1 [Acropora millepora]
MPEHRAIPKPRISFCRKFLSTKTKRELRQIFKLSWPSVLQYSLHNSLFTISLVFAGRFGSQPQWLAAAVLSMSYIAITGTVIGSGVVTAVEALCAHAYYARNYRLVGVVVQRGIWFLGLAVLLVWALWTNTESLLSLGKQEKETARLSQLFVFIWFPALIADFSFVLIQRYLQIQGIFKPIIYVCAFANIMHILTNISLIYGIDLGFSGVPLAFCVTYCLFIGAATFCYMKYFKLYKRTWPEEGWTTESLKHWGQFTSLAVQGLLMLCIEWGSFEAGTFFVGTFGNRQLAAHGILMQYASLAYMVPLGVSVAVSVRVRNTLRKRHFCAARHIMKVSLVLTSCFTITLCIFLIALKDQLGKAFTASREVVNLVSRVTPAMAAFAIFVSIQMICCSVIRGSGRPKLGIFIHFAFYYCVALPLGVTFASYGFTIGLEGFWWGINVGLLFQTIAFIPILKTMDWGKYTKTSLIRMALDRPASGIRWSAATDDIEEENLVASWLSRTSSLFSVNANPSVREFTHPPDPVMSWIVRSSSLLSLHNNPLRAIYNGSNESEQPLPDRNITSAARQPGVRRKGISPMQKQDLIGRRLRWLILALLVLLCAVIVRVVTPVPKDGLR